MSNPISLLLGMHAHQPVGNFPDVLEDAHLRCYKPFFEVMHRYPEFRFAVHFSGWLLDYLLQHFPGDMALLQEMVARRQVELFGAGDTEPVLAAIPYRDRIGQIETFSRKLEEKFGQRPQGAWLTERVWESSVVPALVACGIRYAIVDDYHFLCAGKTSDELDGYFTTEEDARALDLFPISETLRYKIPFAPAEETVAYLETLADRLAPTCQAAAVYFDDIEKFGIWPETYRWVYEQGWLEQFIQKTLASSKIRTRHYSEYHADAPTRGIVYLPTVSYIEMNEWTLSAQSADAYAELAQQVRTGGGYAHKKAFVRGGIWKNFLSRYPESNWMHKRMLKLSARLAALPEQNRSEAMQRKLYQAQANDAYWHGLFGGLYLPHLRRTVYRNLIELEALLDAYAPRPVYFTEDTDLDGVDEAYLQNGVLQAILKLDCYAAIRELDVYPLKHNFGDTLRSQTEHYYRKIHGEQRVTGHPAQGIASAHDRIDYKHDIRAEDTAADDHPRSLFVDRLDGLFIRYRSLSSALESYRFQSTNTGYPIDKHIVLDGHCLQVSYRFTAKPAYGFSTEINLAMPSCDGTGGRYRYHGKICGGFGQSLTLPEFTGITLDDDTLGGHIVLNTSRPVTLRANPHFSVSQSESGFEKIMQAVTLLLECPVTATELTVTLTFNAH